jgi:hypothetical protein
VILYSDRDAFDKAISRFQTVIEKYQAALRKKLSESRAAFESRIVGEFAPKWEQNPPRHFSRVGYRADAPKHQGRTRAVRAGNFESGITFDEPKVKVLYKNVAPENIQDRAFLEVLKNIMIKRRVPPAIIASLFESGQAAPETGAFVGR